MTVAALLLGAGGGRRWTADGSKLLAPWGATTVVGAALDAVLAAAASGIIDEVLVVDGAADLAAVVAHGRDVHPGARVEVIHHSGWADGQAGTLQRGLAVAAERGHDVVVVGLADQPAVTTSTWLAVAETEAPIVVAEYPRGDRRPPVRLHHDVWSLLPTTGDEGARVLMRERPDLVSTVAVAGDPRDVDVVEDLLSEADRDYVAACLGRPPRAAYAVAARDGAGRPTVIANPPFLDDGTPMPTMFWLVDPELNRRIGGLEADGGVNAVEAMLGLDRLAEVHDRYRAQRDARIEAEHPDHTGPRPSGGVGGTRVGVKCLHTHYAWFLAGGDDPVGAWVHDRLHRPVEETT